MIPRCIRPLLFTLPFLLLACHDEGPVDTPSGSAGILFSAPVLGATETYVGYQYGTLVERDSVKTYTQDRMTWKVVAVSDRELRLEETVCYGGGPACLTQELKVDRGTGKVEALGESQWSVLTAVNAFPNGIFSENPSRTIPFEGYSPMTQEPTVGVAADYQVGGKTYAKVTVLADPTDIPVDGGGKCLILTRDDRLLEILSYQVFGVDGGWEIQE